MTWKDISLYRYQKIDAILNNKDYDDLDKTFFCVCEVYGITEQQLEKIGIHKAAKMARKVAAVVNKEPKARALRRIGLYNINYNPDTYSFGQYVELMYYMQEPIQNAHYVMASISDTPMRHNDSLLRYKKTRHFLREELMDWHPKKAAYFHARPVLDIIGSLKLFIERFAAFNAQYKTLFGLDKEVHEESAIINRFNKVYGWQYSARQIKNDQGIPLKEVYKLNVREALNALAFLKAQSRYEAELFKQQKDGR